jgi:hypothetical protein
MSLPRFIKFLVNIARKFNVPLSLSFESTKEIIRPNGQQEVTKTSGILEVGVQPLSNPVLEVAPSYLAIMCPLCGQSLIQSGSLHRVRKMPHSPKDYLFACRTPLADGNHSEVLARVSFDPEPKINLLEREEFAQLKLHIGGSILFTGLN